MPLLGSQNQEDLSKIKIEILTGFIVSAVVYVNYCAFLHSTNLGMRTCEHCEHNEIESTCGWVKITQWGPIEIWKTPNKYLACYHYLNLFEFVPTLEEAKEKAKLLYEKNVGKD